MITGQVTSTLALVEEGICISNLDPFTLARFRGLGMGDRQSVALGKVCVLSSEE